MVKVQPAPPDQAAPAPASMERTGGPRPLCNDDGEAAAWARGWWAERDSVGADKGAMVDELVYQLPSALFEQLEPTADGGLPPVKLMRMSWLLGRADALRAASTPAEREELKLPRRQVLERECPFPNS